eukprot:177555-Chlamydomonas_euryale.AAC.6
MADHKRRRGTFGKGGECCIIPVCNTPQQHLPNWDQDASKFQGRGGWLKFSRFELNSIQESWGLQRVPAFSHLRCSSAQPLGS